MSEESLSQTVIRQNGEIDKLRDENKALREQLAQAQADKDYLELALKQAVEGMHSVGQTVSEFANTQRDFLLKSTFGKGWLSPDESAKLQAQCAAKDAALKTVSEEIGDMASLLIESDEQEDSTIGKAWRALIKQTILPALSTTAGQDLLKKLQRYEKELTIVCDAAEAYRKAVVQVTMQNIPTHFLDETHSKLVCVLDQAREARKGDKSEFIETYEELKHGIERAPSTWLPGLIGAVAMECIKRNVFRQMPSDFLKTAEATWCREKKAFPELQEGLNR